jgi:hypothetical protein
VELTTLKTDMQLLCSDEDEQINNITPENFKATYDYDRQQFGVLPTTPGVLLTVCQNVPAA